MSLLTSLTPCLAPEGRKLREQTLNLRSQGLYNGGRKWEFLEEEGLGVDSTK